MTKHELPDDDALARRAAHLFRCRERNLDAETLRLLQRARRGAIAASVERSQRPRLIPAAAVSLATASGLVAVLLWQGVLTPVPLSPEPRPDRNPEMNLINFQSGVDAPVVPPFETREPAVLELLFAEDSWELYRNLDFYSSLVDLDEEAVEEPAMDPQTEDAANGPENG